MDVSGLTSSCNEVVGDVCDRVYDVHDKPPVVSPVHIQRRGVELRLRLAKSHEVRKDVPPTIGPWHRQTYCGPQVARIFHKVFALLGKPRAWRPGQRAKRSGTGGALSSVALSRLVTTRSFRRNIESAQNVGKHKF